MQSRLRLLGLLGLALLVLATPVLAQIAQDRNRFTVDGGGGISRGDPFTVHGTIGQHDAGGTLSGGRFTLAGGFWGGGALAPAPIITAINPESILDNRDIQVTINGLNFVSTPRVQLNDRQIVEVRFIRSSELQITVPAGLPTGVYNLTVVNPGGQSGTLARALIIMAGESPQLTSVSPTSIRNDRATTIQLIGSNFVPRSEVFVGSTKLNDVSYLSATLLNAIVPVGLATGNYSVRVTNPGNRSSTLANALTITLAPPTISRVSPNQGRNDRTTTLVISGSGFVPGSQAWLGATTRLPLLRYNGPTQIEVLVPSQRPPGRYAIRVTNSDGQNASLPDAFTVTELQRPPPFSEIVFVGWEVTQGIQNLLNDVPLVADKPTYVRVYGRLAAGEPAPQVNARLQGFRNGVALPGSPLAPLNGTRDLRVGVNFDRANANDSWTFRIPEHWYREGTLELRVELDPERRYDTINRANNVASGNFVFNRRGATCLVFVPIRNAAPTVTWNDPHFARMVDRATRMMPTARLIEFTRSTMSERGFLGFSAGAFELPDDNSKINVQLSDLGLFDRPNDARCRERGAATHFVGLLHATAQTHAEYPNRDIVGLAHTPGRALWVKLPHPDEVPIEDNNWPARGVTLAHEIGHNYGRQHVNCDGPERPDQNYPYDPCRLDDRYSEPEAYFGFDSRTLQPIAPDRARDLLAYGRPRWPSDYTWRAFYSRSGPSVASLLWVDQPESPGNLLQPWRSLPPMVDPQNSPVLVAITGLIDQHKQQGELGYAWRVAEDQLDPGARDQWRELLAAPYTGSTDLSPYPLAPDRQQWHHS